jgi:ABC-type uncharacterized transport system substrate-binding protein
MRVRQPKKLVGLLFMTALWCSHGCSQKNKTVLFLSSFKQGDASADSALSGVRSVLSQRRDVVIRSHFFDLHPDSFQQDSIRKLLRVVQKSKPDVLITYGDDAVKYIVGPHFRKGPLPVVFCGVQWACDQYGLPTETVTGMVDIPPLQDIIRMLNPYYHNMVHMAVISKNSALERRNRKYMDALFRQIGIRADYELLEDFEKWKAAFIRANDEADAIYLAVSNDIAGWNNFEATEFILRHIRKPVITCDKTMMRFAVFGITRVNREQGEWAARTTIAILDGKVGFDIPVAVSRESVAYWNPVLAQRIEFKPKPEFLKQVHLFQ